MAISSGQLARIMPHAGLLRRLKFLGPLRAAMTEFGVSLTNRRAAAFLAEVAAESGELQFMRELWGPTAVQRGYEGREDLGNTQPGDGFRFRGAGPFQLTGRANFTEYGLLLGLPLAEQPELAGTPAVGCRIAGAYWDRHGCNNLSDAGEFAAVTRAINGGLNGEEQRLRYYHRALQVLGG